MFTQSQIDDISRHIRSNNEIEVRFKGYSKSGIDIRTFDRLKEYYKNLLYESVNTLDLIKSDENVRLTIDSSGNEKAIKKALVSRQESNGFNLFIAVSLEKNLEYSNEQITTFKTDLVKSENRTIRSKNRLSYRLVDTDDHGGVQLDLTVVHNNIRKNGKSITDITYEVELELIDHNKLNSLLYFIPKILSVIQDTEILYTVEEYHNIIKFTNTIIGGRSESYQGIDNVLMDARNLKYKDLVNTGLLGGTVSYRVSVKSDGLRKLLVIHSSGVWLIWNNEANKIYESIGSLYSNCVFDGELIPVGSRKNTNKIVTQKYWYLIFDTIGWADLGGSNIRSLTHENRMSAAQSLVDRLEKDTTKLSELLQINTKLFYKFLDSPTFFSTMRTVDSIRKELEYKDDGFIFVPNNYEYKRTLTPQHLRILPQQPDICKWKERMDLTIDFSVKLVIYNEGKSKHIILQGYDSNSKRHLINTIITNMGSNKRVDVNIDPLLFNSMSNKLVRFKYLNTNYVSLENFNMTNVVSGGRIKFTFNRDSGKYMGKETTEREFKYNDIISSINNKKDFVARVDWREIDGIKYMELYIVDKSYPYKDFPELQVDENNELLSNITNGLVIEFKNENDIYIPIRKRYNKIYPNSIETIKDNIRMINDPIELSTLRGEDIKLMRKYHNTIKDSLFRQADGEYLLDLGSGRGGDVSKWMSKGYKKIVAIEPNLSHIKELSKRIMGIYGLNKVPVVKDSSDLILLSNESIVIVNTVAQDHKLISEVTRKLFDGQADVISMMLSLSFFETGSTDYDNLMVTVGRNLKIGGSFIYLTVDGEKVNNIFDPIVKGPIIKELDLLNGDVSFKLNKEQQKLSVYFRNTIVGSELDIQEEYLVLLNKIKESFLSMGITEVDYEDASKETFLNESETIITKMYTFGKFTRKQKDTLTTKTVSRFLTQGNPVKSLIVKCKKDSNGDDTIISEVNEKVNCKWYLNETIKRLSVPNYENDAFVNLITAVIRSANPNYSKSCDKLFDLADDYKSKVLNGTPETEIVEKEFVIKLGGYLKVDISLVEITSTNLIPIVTKFGNFDNCIVIGKTLNGYEPLYITRNIDQYIFSGKGNVDTFIISLVSATLLGSINEEKSKIAEKHMGSIINNKDYKAIISNFEAMFKLR